MNRINSSTRNRRTSVAVLAFVVLGLAASPAALAKDRGGPGQPGAQEQTNKTTPVLPRKFGPRRSVSWSD